jgi:hypothetical protein
VRGRAGRAGRPPRSPGRHVGRGPGAVPRQPLVPRRVRGLRLAGRRGADPRRRPDRRLGVRAEHVDDAPWSAGRPVGHRRPGRRHPRGHRRAPCGRRRRRG